MFQYAVGRALSIKRGCPLYLDISAFENHKIHQGFELPRIFSCDVSPATEKTIKEVLTWQYPSWIRRAVSKKFFSGIRKRNFIIEPHFHYWPGIHEIPSFSYIYGNWQSEKYFYEIKDIIKKDFSFSAPLQDKNIALANQIFDSNSVSLHIRRGDYVSNPEAASFHGTILLNYYYEAIEYISKNIQNPCFFVFSDDIPWVKDNLKIKYPCVFVDNNINEDSFFDMYLMSLCKHNIIANSTFSWWGAWLNENKNKIVISPDRWFSDKNIKSDLIPDRWFVF